MRRSSLAVTILLLAGPIAADDFYLPLGGQTSRTELEVVNTSARAANVTIALLGNTEGFSTKSTQIALDAGKSIRWSDAVAEVFGHYEPGLGVAGVLRVGSDVPLRVTARSHCTSCGTTSSVPVLDQRFAVDEGTVPEGVSSNDRNWRSGIVIVNPSNASALTTIALQRGGQVIEESIYQIPSRGMRRLRTERFFRWEREPDDVITFHADRHLLVVGYDANDHTGARVFTAIRSDATGRRRRAVRFTSSLPPVVPQTIVLVPKKDNTLFESPDGGISNGAGIHLFAGATGSEELRRALLAFDVAAQLPPGSRITGATLTMRVSQTIAAAQTMALHRVTADWGEGTSNAGSSRDGAGAPSRPGDATWLHRFFPDQLWSTMGGDFNPAADATASVEFASGTWSSSAAMIARVQEWLDQPSSNFGWIVIGNEQFRVTAKRFDSREVTTQTKPTLTIDFER